MNLIVNGESIVFENAPSMRELLRHINADPQRVAVLVNEEVIPSNKRDTCVLHDSDRVEILSLAGGG